MISIVIPSYNQDEYLPDAIESVIKQCTDVIVVDDGSTDNSLDIAMSYKGKHKNLRVIRQVNKGLASARNTGIMNSWGNYVMFLDADDMLMDNAILKITNAIKETKADIIAPSFKTFGISNEEVILMQNPKLEDFYYGSNRLGYFCAIKKEALLEVGGYSPRMTWGYEDYHLTINLLTRGKTIHTLQEPLVLYRTKKESMWTEAMKHHNELISQIKKDFPSYV